MESTQKASSKTIYDASLKQIAFKNFVAGFMHGLGGFVLTLASWAVLYYLFTTILLPQLAGMLGQAEGLMKSVQGVQSLMGPSPTQTPGKMQQIEIPPGLLEQFQQMQRAQ